MSRDIPPGRLSELDEVLADPTIDCYLVIGTGSTRAWKIAKAVEFELPPLQAIRIQSRSDASKWLQDHPDAVGVTFGYGDTPKDWLSQADAENKDIVLERVRVTRPPTSNN